MSTELPDRRKRADNQLAAHARAMEDRLRRFFTKALIAFTVLGLTSAGSLLGFGIVLKEQGKTAKANEDLLVIVQSQRYETIFQNCHQQNLRHDNAIKKAQTLPRETERIVRLLVDELQPYTKDCVKLARSRVRGVKDAK